MSPTGHPDAQTLAEHAEGLLGSREDRLVAAHLAACSACRSTALRLASIPAWLAAAAPPPMPAEHVARLNLTLARLAVTEPAGHPQRPRAAGSAQVVDLATGRRVDPTRRRLPGGALRRVGTVAATLALLGAGAGLGVGTALLGNRQGSTANPYAADTPAPTAHAVVATAVFDIPADAAPDGHGNWVEHRSGTLYVPRRSGGGRTAGKVIRPDGSEIVPDAAGQPSYLRPPHRPGAGKPGPRPVAEPDRHGQPAGPYLSRSGQEYDEDNFAANVMDLLVAAGKHSGPPHHGSGHRRTRRITARPDGWADLRARAARCSARIGRKALAADEGRWAGQVVTVLVLADADAGQVTGWVVVGDCSGSGPLGARESLWQQRVDRPGGAPIAAPAPAPTRTPDPVRPQPTPVGPTDVPQVDQSATDPAAPPVPQS